jgi:ribA/ribD-fused uncharacterized protein
MIKFSKPNGPWGELSNFYAHEVPLLYEGKQWATSEHLYQALRYIWPGAPAANADYVELIRTASTPFKAKILSRQLCLDKYKWQQELTSLIKVQQARGIQQRLDWEAEKVSAMRTVLHLKFTQDQHCASILRATGTAEIGEESATDNVWALGANGKGENRLGKLLCVIRDSIKLTQ